MTIYGVDSMPFDTLIAHRRSLLAILGANGAISDEERDWVMIQLQMAIDFPEIVTAVEQETIDSGNFSEIDLEEELAKNS